MAYYFFPATKVAAAQMTELFDFAWPTAAALWNLRWQVAGFLQEVPSATPVQLNDRFVFGSNIYGTNLKRACVETSWDEQKQKMSAIILTNAFAIYELWADEILSSLGMPSDSGKKLQFNDGPGSKIGLPGTVQALCSTESRPLKAAYYPVYSQSSKYSWSIITNLLACYRFFKELRNSQIHNGGRASKKAAQAFAAFAPISNKVALGMRGELIHDPIREGDRVALHLRGVVGFCDVLFRMMVTVDAELCRSIVSESVLVNAFKETKLPPMFSGKVLVRRRQVRKCCRAAGLPKPANVDEIYRFILSHKLVHV